MTAPPAPKNATILIVAKTRMQSACCVGGLVLEDNRNVRLLQRDGRNQPGNTDLEVGQIWLVKYIVGDHLVPPHVEDIKVLERTRVGGDTHMHNCLLPRVHVWSGGPSALFDGRLVCGEHAHWYLSRTGGIPRGSVGYWKPDHPLQRRDEAGSTYFRYYNPDTVITAVIKYVGYAPVGEVDRLSAGTMARVSLARWWSPNPERLHECCYLQLSGWFRPDE